VQHGAEFHSDTKRPAHRRKWRDLSFERRLLPSLEGLRGPGGSTCICQTKVFWSYWWLVLLPAGWLQPCTRGGFWTHRRSHHRNYRRVHWRLVTLANRYPSWHRHCFRDHQCHHWRRHTFACGWASTRWWPVWGRLGQTPMVVAAGKKK
jgi:hypothetical protein